MHVAAQTTTLVCQKLQLPYLSFISLSPRKSSSPLRKPSLSFTFIFMAGRPGDMIMSAEAFIRLTSLLLVWIICPPSAMFAAASPLHPHPRPRFDSLHPKMLPSRLANNAVPHYYYYESGSVEELRWASMAPAATPPKQRRKRAPPPHGIKTTKVKRRRKKDKNRLKNARTVGYFFAGIAILLQVAVVAFLLIKRKQMIGVVHKYDEAPPEWNGIHASA